MSNPNHQCDMAPGARPIIIGVERASVMCALLRE